MRKLCVKNHLLRHHRSLKWEKILEGLKKQEAKPQKYHGCDCLLLKVNNTALFVSEIKLETRHLAPIKYFEMFSNQIHLPKKWKGKKDNRKQNKTKQTKKKKRERERTEERSKVNEVFKMRNRTLCSYLHSLNYFTNYNTLYITALGFQF